MAPSKAPATSWDDSSSEEDSSDAGTSAPAVAPVARRSKFADEEDEDVLDDWEEGEDSEVEREKAKKAAALKAAEEAKARAAKKSRAQKIEEKIEENRRRKEVLSLEVDSDDEEDEAARRAKARASEKESDLQNAEDLFGGVGGVPNTRGAKPVTVLDESEPGNAIDLSSMALFNPNSPQGFQQLRETLVKLLTANSKKPAYALFLPELAKQLCRDLNSEQVRKVGGVLNTLSNEKMKEEKAAEKGGKKTKAAKTKATLNANRDISSRADTGAYDDDGLDDGDFM